MHSPNVLFMLTYYLDRDLQDNLIRLVQGSNDALVRTRTKVMSVWGEINEQIGKLEENALHPVCYMR